MEFEFLSEELLDIVWKSDFYPSLKWVEFEELESGALNSLAYLLYGVIISISSGVNKEPLAS
jgi:hypothetical protein